MTEAEIRRALRSADWLRHQLGYEADTTELAHFDVLVALAERAVEVPRGFTRCDECEGTGEVCSAFCDSNDRTVDAHPHHIRCPSCSGSGLVPTEKLREDAAASLWESWWDYRREPWKLALSKRPIAETDLYREQADAVLRKVAEHIREER